MVLLIKIIYNATRKKNNVLAVDVVMNVKNVSDQKVTNAKVAKIKINICLMVNVWTHALKVLMYLPLMGSIHVIVVITYVKNVLIQELINVPLVLKKPLELVPHVIKEIHNLSKITLKINKKKVILDY